MLNILSINLALSTIVFWVSARIYILPRLSETTCRDVIIPILLLHMSRHLGLMFLSPGATYAGVPIEFARPAALGDFGAAALAAVALYLLLKQSSAAKGATWLFNVWGTIDLIAAITLATYFNAEPFMGPAYWIPAFWVPALLVTHYLTFLILVRHWRTDSTVAPGRAYR